MEYTDQQLRQDQGIASLLLALLGMGALYFFYSRNEILLSGDAVAHINISRRIFDSRTPSLLQLGTVWLPLQHVLTVPFIVPQKLWQSGVGGSVISVLAFVIGGRGILRLAQLWGSRAAAWLALAIYAFNPNLLYVQSTALNEPLGVATLIWATLYFSEFIREWEKPQQHDVRSMKQLLWKGTLTLDAAMLTRYDGWFVALLCWTLVFVWTAKSWFKEPGRFALLPHIKRTMALCLVLTALAPALWMAYNYMAFGNALDFANGPYSAKAIAERTTPPGAVRYPGYKNPVVAALYFEKDARLNLGARPWADILFIFAIAGSVWSLVEGEVATVILLWSMLAFYPLSIAYGSVPIFMPDWYPFSYYNTRYGLELLPAIAVGFAGCMVYLEKAISSKKNGRWIWALTLVLAASYISACYQIPVCLRETRANGKARLAHEALLANTLKRFPEQSTLLTYVGDHSGALQRAGIPFRRTINEGNRGWWQMALRHPAQAADFVIASQGDPVAQAVKENPEGLEMLEVLHTQGQPPTTIYRSSLRH